MKRIPSPVNLMDSHNKILSQLNTVGYIAYVNEQNKAVSMSNTY